MALRRIPWRKLKTLAVVCCMLALLHVIWSLSGISDTVNHSNDSRGVGSVLKFIPNGQFLPQLIRTKPMCKKIVPFDTHGGVISTYDLPEEADYTLDDKGKYKIPAEFYENEKKPLDHEVNVILVPFSHADPGYGMTVEQYYQSGIKHALNNMVEHLWEYKNMTFQWAEVVFLERWFRDISKETKDKVRELIRRGQFEIVLGGWVMPDEASTHYAAVVDQLIEGHQWLQDELGVKVVNAWINDPFGYSSTMPYIWKKSGIENIVILRMHQAIKARLMHRRMMDYKWRPYWNPNDDVNDILVNVMPYPGYWNSDVCGPVQDVCKKFNFLHMNRAQEAKPVTDQNVAELSKQLYDAYKFTASLYKYKTLIIFIGEDNSYGDRQALPNTNFNYGKLMKYINEQKDWKMKLRFGTIADYVKHVREVELKQQTDPKIGGTFPLLSGDYFPYSDFEHDIWTGYYTTRIWMKRFLREIEPVLRMADVYSVMAYQLCIREKHCPEFTSTLNTVLADLRSARRNVGILQHHDGITGTSLPGVVSDYESRLKDAFDKTKSSLTTLVRIILSADQVKATNALESDLVKNAAKSILSRRGIKVTDGTKLVMANPLERSRHDAVSFYLDRTDIELVDHASVSIPFQVSTSGDPKYSGQKMVTVEVDLLPYEIKTVEVKSASSNPKAYHAQQKDYSGPATFGNVVVIKNDHLTVVVDPKTGMLESLTDKNGETTKLDAMFLKYKPQKSGAYLFGPAGPAQPLDELTIREPRIRVINGSLFSQIEVNHENGFNQKFTLYHTNSIKSSGLFITNEITLEKASSLSNTEIVVRFNTDINNNNKFFTDQNGFQLMGRKNNPDRPIETNFYPISNMVVLEDEEKRLTLHSAQSHGVASLSNGWLEVMLDRNVRNDDRKGLGMGVNERVLTLTEFVLEVQYKTSLEPIPEPRYTYPTHNSILLNEQLQSKVQLFSTNSDSDKFDKKFTPSVPQFPCDVSVVGMRFLLMSDNTFTPDVSLVLHHKPTHCSFQSNDSEPCNARNGPLTAKEFMKAFDVSESEVFVSIRETSLSHVTDLATLSPETDLAPGFGELRSYVVKL